VRRRSPSLAVHGGRTGAQACGLLGGMRFAAKTYGFALVVCYRREDDTWLSVKEVSTKGGGYWLPGGGVDYGESYETAAVRETREEAGIDVRLVGVLGVQHNPRDDVARMHVFYFARPRDPRQTPKAVPDAESECAKWLSYRELRKLPARGDELLTWIRRLQEARPVRPLSVFCRDFLSADSHLSDTGGAMNAEDEFPAVSSRFMVQLIEQGAASGWERVRVVMARCVRIRRHPAVVRAILVAMPRSSALLQSALLERGDFETRLEPVRASHSVAPTTINGSISFSCALPLADFCLLEQLPAALDLVLALAHAHAALDLALSAQASQSPALLHRIRK